LRAFRLGVATSGQPVAAAPGRLYRLRIPNRIVEDLDMARAQSKPELTPNMVPIGVQHAVIMALRPEARRRDVSVDRLIQDLLSVIVTDHLTTAVLGDD
jgi:hypothetical protein